MLKKTPMSLYLQPIVSMLKDLAVCLVGRRTRRPDHQYFHSFNQAACIRIYTQTIHQGHLFDGHEQVDVAEERKSYLEVLRLHSNRMWFQPA